MLANPSSFDVALTTYEMVQSQQLGMSLCRTIYWRYLVLDEGHKIKNEHTNVAHTMRQVRWEASSFSVTRIVLKTRPANML